MLFLIIVAIVVLVILNKKGIINFSEIFSGILGKKTSPEDIKIVPIANADLQQMFIDQNEQRIAVLGSGYLRNFLAGGTLESGFCIVSDKRVYFRGKCYYKVGSDYKRTLEERTVDVKDITGTGFTETRSYWLKITAIIGTIAAVVLYASVMSDPYASQEPINMQIALSPLLTWLLYFFRRQKVFEISFAGGRIAFKASAYNVEEMQNFQKTLRKAKDNYTPAPQYIVNTPVPNVPASNTQAQNTGASTADELKKLKDLLDAGAITQEEYNTLKAKALNL